MVREFKKAPKTAKTTPLQNFPTCRRVLAVPSDALYVHCFHCGRNQRRRFRGTWFTCKHCGKRNPGPSILGELLRDRLGIAPAANTTPAASVTVVTNGATKAPANGGTLIKSGKSKEAATSTPAAAKKEAPKKPATTSPPAEKGRSLLGRVMHG